MDRKELLKNLTIGFLPLLVFIVADELFDLLISLLIAMAVGLLELAVTYFREKKFDKFILLDLTLIGSLGLVSVALENPVFILIKPAIIEAIFVVLIGITIFTDNPLLINMSARYMKGMALADQQIEMMRRMLHTIFWLFIGHIILVVAAAIYVGQPDTPGYLGRKEIWAFVSGGLLYILMGISFIFQFVKGKLNQRKTLKQYADDEWFDLVTPEGKIVGKAPRSLCHGNPDLLHPVVHVHVFNSKGELWLQKRAENKKIQPGKWDTSVGGHVACGETIEQGLAREIAEELGVERMPHWPLFNYVMRNEIESELVYAFRGNHSGPFKWPESEIQDGKFWKIKAIRKNMGKSVFTPNFEQEFGILKKLKII